MTLFYVNAFTDKLFTGNPAAVFLLDNEANTPWMQALAHELNLSETAFAWPENGGFRLRWFTPSTEVPLCGHGTLATAHAIYESGLSETTKPILFHTLSGKLVCEKTSQGISMNFPLNPVLATSARQDIYDAIGLKETPHFIGAAVNSHTLLIELGPTDRVENMNPDLSLLQKMGTPNIIITQKGDSNSPYDFVSRYFGIENGIPEDPVTGSAHCILAYYWSKRLNKKTFLARQASKRGGDLSLKIAGERLEITGKSITVLSAQSNPILNEQPQPHLEVI